MRTQNTFLGMMLIFILFPAGSALWSQEKPMVFHRLTTRDGLSQNRVNSIIQDNDGFIWVGTEDGLNRYDGYEFTVFKTKVGDSLTISDNYVTICYKTEYGELWFGTEFGGLNHFNPMTQTFTSYEHDHRNPETICSNFITAICEGGNGNLWIGSAQNGFDHLDTAKKKFTHSKHLLPPGYQIGDDEILFLHQDRNNLLWLGGRNRLHVFNVEYVSGDVPVLTPVYADAKKIEDPVSIEEDQNGNIWIGTYNSGLYKFEHTSGSLTEYELKNEPDLLDSYRIPALEENQQGELWVSAYGLGIIKLTPVSGDWQLFQNDPKDGFSLSQDLVLSLFTDRTGILWAGTDFAGINIFDPSLIKFKRYLHDPAKPDALQIRTTRSFLKDETGSLWIASSSDGLAVINYETGESRHYLNNPNDPNSISANIVFSLKRDSDHTLWVGTIQGLNKFNPQTGYFKHFYVDPSTPESGVNTVNYEILELPVMPGYLWFGSNGGGLIRFDKTKETFKQYTYDPESESSLNNRDNYVRTLYYSVTRPDELWLGTTHGINIFNLKTEKFRYYIHDPDDPGSLSHNNVMNFHEDDEGIIWIGTYGGGLNRFDHETQRFRSFTEDNSGLPNDAVYAILPDESGNLWLSTNKGISRFNPDNETFRNFTVDDGLQSEEYNGGSYYRSSDGELFFGGLSGFNSFYPDRVRDNLYQPQLALTDLRIFNESVPLGTDSPLSEHVNRADKIVLEHWQNDISFEYVALHFTRPLKNQYAFRLENYDKDWRYVGNSRRATYTNLDPGEYVFRVKGSNSDGIWNEEGKSIRLVINPPWWETNLAYAGYVLLFILAVMATDRIQRVRVTRKEREKAKLALLEAENKRKTDELEEARKLQLSMLPKTLPQIPNLDIAVYMKTATEVGGDYYDFHVDLDGTLTVVIGDATGHGMKAGTIVTASKSLFSTHAANPDILSTFHEMTRCLKQMDLHLMSMCMTIMKLQNNCLKFSSAGMPPALLHRSGNGHVEELLVKGMPLGTFNDFPYEIKDTTINPGDTILLMSDGLPELFNDKKEMFGYERVLEIFEKSSKKSAEKIIEDLQAAGAVWVQHADPQDDVTFVVLKYK